MFGVYCLEWKTSKPLPACNEYPTTILHKAFHLILAKLKVANNNKLDTIHRV